MKENYNIAINGTVEVSYIFVTTAVTAKDAVERLQALSPERAAITLLATAHYELGAIEREVTGWIEGEQGDSLPGYVFHRRHEVEFAPPAGIVMDGLELTGDAVASRYYQFQAVSWADALEQFDRLSEAQLNAPSWSVWGIDFEPHVHMAAAPDDEWDLGEEDFSDIACLLEETLRRPSEPAAFRPIR